MLFVIDSVAECAGGTGFDGLDDSLDTGAVGIDPGLHAHAPHRGQAIRAHASVGAHATVIVNGNRLADVVASLAFCAFGLSAVLETDVRVGAVAERLVLRSATTAQREGFLDGDGFATGIRECGQSLDQIGTVRLTGNDRRWTRLVGCHISLLQMILRIAPHENPERHP